MLIKSLKSSFFFFLLLFLFNFNLPQTNAANYDFHIESIEIEENPVINEDVDITIEVMNYSTVDLMDLTGINDYFFKFDNFRLISIGLPNISASKPVEVLDSFKYSIKGRFIDFGEVGLKFGINTKNNPYEANKANNTKIKIINVVSAQDMQIEDIKISPPKPAVNEECEIKVVIKNTGDIALFTNIGINDFLRDFEDFQETQPFQFSKFNRNIFKKDEYFYYTYRGKFYKSGNKKLSFAIDVNNVVTEKDEEDNAKEVSVEVLPASSLDVAFDSIEFSHDDLLLHTDTDITVKFKNTGSVSLIHQTGISESSFEYTLPNFSVTGFEFSDYPTVEDAFEPDEIFEYKFTGRFNRQGNLNLDFKIDKYNFLTESDESNNIASIPITVYLNQDAADDFEIFNIQEHLISSSSVEVSWETTKEANSEVRYNKRGFGSFDRYKIPQFIEEWPYDNDETKIHKIILEDLKNDAFYEYEVNSKRGNVEKRSSVKVLITPGNDKIVVTVMPQVVPSEQASTSVDIIWSTNFSSDSYVYYKKDLDESYIKAGEATSVLEHSVNINNLTPGQYNYYVTSTSTDHVGLQSDIYGFLIKEKEEIKKSSSATSSAKATAGNEEISIINNKTKFEKEQEQYQSELGIVKGDDSLKTRVNGRIVLLVESHGEAWYFNPQDSKKYYLGRPNDALNIMRYLGIGISNDSLEKIQIGGEYVPKVVRDKVNYSFANKHKGKIFLQVESNGEAWYVNPIDLKRYYLGRPTDAFQVMRDLSIGIKNSDFIKL